MKRKFRLLAIAAACFAVSICAYAADKNIQLMSPDGHVVANIKAGSNLSYSVFYDGEQLLGESKIQMKLTDGSTYGGGKLLKFTRRSADETFRPVAYKRAEVRDHYNEVTLSYKNCNVIFRAYDDCLAYRFVSKSKKDFKVRSETAEFNFAGDWNSWAGFSWGEFESSFENIYEYLKLSAIHPEKLAFLPQMIDAPKGIKINIMESALYKYPGMYLKGDGSSCLHGNWPQMPKELQMGGYNDIQELVKSRHDYLAECKAGEAFPWRIVAISTRDIDMATNDIVYRLGDAPAKGSDFGWVKPGKVAWDWWNGFYVTGVDFVAGINNDTYKHYIDFASENGIEYIIMDDGWSQGGYSDLFHIVPEINLEELVAYANERNVGIILWAGYYAFHRDIEKVCSHYSKMGIKGFKVDFMDRDDQLVMQFYENVAKTAAKYHLLIDFHGAFKPSGLERTYPNIINYEGVAGLEQMKWGAKACDQVTYDVIIPFVRMAAGRMDYTQGAMINCSKGTAYPNNSTPMSQGTRCRQLAEYAIFEAPLTMLCDSPSNYMAEPECTDFIAAFPTAWDETVPVCGKIGEYVAIARRKGNDWYVGALTGWDARDLVLDLGFIGSGKMTVFQDGVNAHRAARDYKKVTMDLPVDGKVHIHMAPGGGWVAKISK